MKIRHILPLIFLGSFDLSYAQKTGDTDFRIQKLIDQMTIEEKVTMIHTSSSFTSGGVERLGIL